MSGWVTALLAAALAGGLLNVIAQAVKWVTNRRSANQPQVVEAKKVHQAVAQADQSLATVARARDELEADNDRLRQVNQTDRERYEKDRDEWRQERSELRAEILRLEASIRESLEEVQALKTRYGIA